MRHNRAAAVHAGYLNVSAAHMVFVPLQRQVSVLLADEANEGFSVSPPLGIQAQRRPSSVKHNTRRMWMLCKQSAPTTRKDYVTGSRQKQRTTYLAMLSPLKNRAMSWSEDCHGKPLARITVLSHTFSILLLHTQNILISQGSSRQLGSRP